MTQQRRRSSPTPSIRRPASGAGRASPSSDARLLEFPKTLPLALMRAREAVMRYFRPTLRDCDLTDQQWRVLRALAHFGPLEAAELAKVAILLSPSLSRILRDLQARKLIARSSVQTDLRRSAISITRKGVAMIDVVAPSSEQGNAEITRRFGEQRLAALHQMLHQLEECLAGEAMAAVPPAGRRNGTPVRRVRPPRKKT